jgi:dihydroorotate dehydrogenase (NAD+) catalytic subunit
MGGVESGADALALLAAGATAVAVGTVNFRDPLAGERVLGELGEELSRREFTKMGDLRGIFAGSTST